jgi:hypothetical protein
MHRSNHSRGKTSLSGPSEDASPTQVSPRKSRALSNPSRTRSNRTIEWGDELQWFVPVKGSVAGSKGIAEQPRIGIEIVRRANRHHAQV